MNKTNYERDNEITSFIITEYYETREELAELLKARFELTQEQIDKWLKFHDAMYECTAFTA